LECEIKRLADKLNAQGLLKLRKVDPPTFTTRGGVMHKTNPFLDFIGCTRNGQMITFEVKCIHSHRLPLIPKGKKGKGISFNQKEAILDWANAGSICGCIWFNGVDYLWISPALLMEHVTQGKKSIMDTDCQLMTVIQGD